MTPNHTVVTNHRERGFACDRTCSYCTWASSPYLPRGDHADHAVADFAARCRKGFVTVSGGGEPLWRAEEHGASVRRLSRIIRSGGKRVRVITRLVGQLDLFRGEFDVASISLDEQSMAEYLANPRAAGPDTRVEFSLVMPPVGTEDLLRMVPMWRRIAATLRAPLVLRENLNSFLPADVRALADASNGALMFVTKELCLSGRYLVRGGADMPGTELIVDAAALLRSLSDAGAYVYGGAARHLAAPLHNPEHTDIDVVSVGPAAIAAAAGHGYAARRMAAPGAYPRYHMLAPARAGKKIHLVEVDSDADAREFIFAAQYDVDRVAYHRGELMHDRATGLELDELRGRIARRVATPVARAPGALRLMSPRREAIERNHAHKLMRKGYSIAGGYRG